MLIDSHAHLGDPALYFKAHELIERAKLAHVNKIINICTDSVTLERGLSLSSKYPFIYNVGATTPHDVEKEGEKNFPIFAQAAREKKLVAIGETGLDYHYDYAPRKLQQEFLINYLELAKETDLPIVIHCREAFDDLFSIADDYYLKKPLLLHCFTGTVKEAEKALERGWKISFSGIVTFKKSEELRHVALATPLDAIFVETDSPYLAPQSKRGQTNEPSFVTETAECVAKLKGVPFEEFCSKVSHNICSFFGL